MGEERQVAGQNYEEARKALYAALSRVLSKSLEPPRELELKIKDIRDWGERSRHSSIEVCPGSNPDGVIRKARGYSE